jgi:hypothetical protein
MLAGSRLTCRLVVRNGLRQWYDGNLDWFCVHSCQQGLTGRIDTALPFCPLVRNLAEILGTAANYSALHLAILIVELWSSLTGHLSWSVSLAFPQAILQNSYLALEPFPCGFDVVRFSGQFVQLFI